MKELFNITDMAVQRLKEFEPKEGYYLAFSGGKDSIVVLDLAKRAGVKFDAHFNLTTVDPPELVYFVRTFPEVQIHKPELTMWKLIVKERIPPTRRMRYCCKVLKEGGGKGRMIMTGVRWAESSSRSKRRMNEHCFRDGRTFYLHPIIDWSEDEVWQYIRSRNLRYCKLYDEGYKRIGCIMCPMKNKAVLIDAERYPKYRDAYIRAFDRCVKKRIADGLKTTWKTGQEMYDWWVNGPCKKQCKPADYDTRTLFED